MGEKIENSIWFQISQSASRKKTASAEVGTVLGPVNSVLHQDSVRVQRQERRFTTICRRIWFTISLRGSSIPQIPEGINQGPPLRLRLRLRLKLRRPRAKQVDSHSPFKWKFFTCTLCTLK